MFMQSKMIEQSIPGKIDLIVAFTLPYKEYGPIPSKINPPLGSPFLKISKIKTSKAKNKNVISRITNKNDRLISFLLRTTQHTTQLSSKVFHSWNMKGKVFLLFKQKVITNTQSKKLFVKKTKGKLIFLKFKPKNKRIKIKEIADIKVPSTGNTAEIYCGTKKLASIIPKKI